MPHQCTCFIFRILFIFDELVVFAVCLAIWAAKFRRCVTTKPQISHVAPLPHSFKCPFNRDIVLYFTPHLVQINRGHPSVSIIIAGTGSSNFPIKFKLTKKKWFSLNKLIRKVVYNSICNYWPKRMYKILTILNKEYPYSHHHHLTN